MEDWDFIPSPGFISSPERSNKGMEGWDFISSPIVLPARPSPPRWSISSMIC